MQSETAAAIRRRSLTTRRSRNTVEHGIQRALFDWRELMTAQHPELELMHAIPNGAGLRHTVKRRFDGKKTRFSAEGYKLKREGMTAGIPDVHLPVARGPYHGLYIEHKTASGTVSTEQAKKMRRLEAEGHCVVLSRDSMTSIDFITRYLALGPYAGKAAGLSVPTWGRKRPRASRPDSSP